MLVWDLVDDMGQGVGGKWVWVGHMVLELVEELVEGYKELVWVDEWVLAGYKELVYELEGDGVLEPHYKSHQLHIPNNHLPHYNSLFGYVHLVEAHDIAQLWHAHLCRERTKQLSTIRIG